MANNKKWTQVTARLNRMTQEGELKWTREDPPESLRGRYVNAEFVYVTEVEDRHLRIYERNFYDHEWDTWDSELVMEFIDKYGNVEWTFPKVSARYDLLESVKYQTAAVDTFLDDFLKKDED